MPCAPIRAPYVVTLGTAFAARTARSSALTRDFSASAYDKFVRRPKSINLAESGTKSDVTLLTEDRTGA